VGIQLNDEDKKWKIKIANVKNEELKEAVKNRKTRECK
jgi:hypothetical protein